MSEKKCKECGNDVSTKASACPHSGARITNIPWSGITIISILFYVLVVAIVSPKNKIPEQVQIAAQPVQPQSSAKINTPSQDEQVRLEIEIKELQNRLRNDRDRKDVKDSKTLKLRAMHFVILEDITWSTEAYGSIMNINTTVNNTGPESVKDIEIT